MKCPRCETPVLQERVREEVVTDVCPECRGVWLDRGELERIIARVDRGFEEYDRYLARSAPDARRGDDRPDWARRDVRYDDDRRDWPRKRRWKDLLGDLFD